MNENPLKDKPLTRSEYIAAMVHFYRGELSKALALRIRLDTTTNWAIITVMGVLSFAFGSRQHGHESIIIGVLLVYIFLYLEGRRFRHFEICHKRVRIVEKNFFRPVLSWDIHGPDEYWIALLTKDLEVPQFEITVLQAIRRRLVSNYFVIFLLLLLAWILKAMIYQDSLNMRWFEKFAISAVDWYIPVAIMAVLYGFLLSIIVFVTPIKDLEED